jgi:DNA repair exonuclease SbcCD ATPase subunit
MKITLKQLILKNFRGVKDLTVDFGDQTSIFGANATGKTTIFDAFTFVLFGKDSSDRSDFEVKPLTQDNQVMHGLDYSVTAVLDIDGDIYKISRVLREKWTKQKGEAEKVLTGNTTEYLINDVPVQMKDFNAKIEEWAENETFKLLTNPQYFNKILPWQKRRSILLEIAGNLTTQEIVAKEPKFAPLVKLLEKTEIDSFRLSLRNQKNKINEELKKIPVRIDEVNSTIDVTTDFEQVRQDIAKYTKDLEEVEAKLLNEAETYKEMANLQKIKYTKMAELETLKHEAERNINKPLEAIKGKIQNIEFSISKFKSETEYGKQKIVTAQKRIEELTKFVTMRREETEKLSKENDLLREEWKEESKKQLVFEDEFICPLCKQPLPPDQKEEKQKELETTFMADKKAKLDAITSKGLHNKNLIEGIEKEIAGFFASIETFKQEIQQTQESIKSAELKIQDLEKEKLSLEITLKEPVKVVKTEKQKFLEDEIEKLNILIIEPASSELQTEKKTLTVKLDCLKETLTNGTRNKKAYERIDELKDNERNLSTLLADIESQEFLCEEFIRTKVDMLEEKINKLFKNVKFKMFNTLINGGIEETCQTLINGVPYSDANNAAKINAGLEIINVISKHYQRSFPVFIDNRESVTKIIPTDCQIANLIVSEKDKTLRIVHENISEEVI